MPARRDALANLPAPTFDDRGGVHAGLWQDRYFTDHAATNGKRDHVASVCAIREPDTYANAFRRWRTALDQMGAMTRTARVGAKAGSQIVPGRMVVGIGDEGPIETHVRLHHTYGVPLVPGSALKGLAASYARNCLMGDWGLALQL